jgi:hypothetical protein
MNNQEMYQSSLAVAKSSEGTLDTQALIYAQSWDAATKRVKASLQGMWDSLINDEFFIDLTDLLAKFLGFVEKLVDGLGGLKGVIMMISALFAKQLAGGAIAGIQRIGAAISDVSGRTQKKQEQMKM